jgi:hypothetical protein
LLLSLPVSFPWPLRDQVFGALVALCKPTDTEESYEQRVVAHLRAKTQRLQHAQTIMTDITPKLTDMHTQVVARHRGAGCRKGFETPCSGLKSPIRGSALHLPKRFDFGAGFDTQTHTCRLWSRHTFVVKGAPRPSVAAAAAAAVAAAVACSRFHP